MPSVVITGASTGIGWATSKLLLDRGFRVFGSVRKQVDADRLREQFGANFTPLLFDVTDEAQVLAAARDVRRVEVISDRTISMRMLFDPGHSLEERILREQFGY